jgi:hypothetical protein
MAEALERTIADAAEQWLIYEPVWDLRPAGEQVAVPTVQRSLRPTGLRRWLASASVLLIIFRPLRRKQPRPPQDP